MLFKHKKPKCINFNTYCAYGYIKPHLNKLGIITHKATFERNPFYLYRKAQMHPFELLLHIWLLNHFLHKLHIITPKTTLELISRYLCTKCINHKMYQCQQLLHISRKAQMHQFQQLLRIWLY